MRARDLNERPGSKVGADDPVESPTPAWQGATSRELALGLWSGRRASYRRWARDQGEWGHPGDQPAVVAKIP